MRSVILTGATSMIGCALIRECLANGVRVIALARKGSSKLSRLPASPLLTLFECDLDQMRELDDRQLRDAVRSDSADCFYHFGWTWTDHAGRNSPEKQELNIRYTLDAVDLAGRCGCRKFVGAGSQAEYGRADVPLNADVPCRPEVAYGVAKYAAGLLARMKCQELGLSCNWVRILSVYGPNDSPATLIKTFIASCREGKPIDLGPCTHQWDYLFEDDAGRAFFALGDRGVDGKTYCLGSGSSRPLKDYLGALTARVNPGYSGANFGAIPYGERSLTYLKADISELTADTGWRPAVSFEDGIGRML